MGALQPWHIIVLAVVVVALFGYNKLPDVTRSVGRSLRIFKTEMKGLSEDDKVREGAQATVAPSVAPVPVQVEPPVATPAPVPAEPTAEQIAQAQAVLAAAAKAAATPVAGSPAPVPAPGATAAPSLDKHVADSTSSAH